MQRKSPGRVAAQTGEHQVAASLLLTALLEARSEREESGSGRWGMLKFGEKRCAGKIKVSEVERQARQQL